MTTPAQILAQNPGLFQSLVGRDSGYLATLPPEVKRRINALKNLQKSHAELEGKFREEVLALEKKYQVLYRPLYDQRYKFVVGDVEPTEEQATYREPDEEDEPEPTPQVDRSGEPPVKGIPEFWLTALKNMPQIQDMITDADEAALKHLTDLRVSYLDDNPGFKLEFEFADNEFFTDRVLTKTYFLQNDPDSPYDDLLYDHAEGCPINWKEGKNLSVKIETKKQRHKATNKVRIVKKEVPAETFFSFFAPPKAPEPKDHDEEASNPEDEDLDAKLEEDYEIGEMLKEKLIPHAIDWFTGKALEYDDDLFDEDDSEEDEDEDEDDEDDA